MDYRGVVNQLRHHPWLTTVLVALMIGMHAWTIVPQVNIPDHEEDYYVFVLRHSLYCDINQIPYFHDSPISARNQLKWYFNCVSSNLFDNPKVISVAFNILVMPMVYLVALAFTKDRLISFIAVAAFINNPLYTDWEGSGTYDQAWAFFLLLAIWLGFRTKASMIPYVASIATKGLALMYLPAYLYTVYKMRGSKMEVMLILGVVGVMVMLAAQYSNIVGNEVGFFPERWDVAVFRNISVLWQVIPFLGLIIVLNRSFVPKTPLPNIKIIGIWIGVILLQNPLISFFTLQDTYSYRYVPLAAFMSILLGQTIIQIGNWYQEVQLRKAAKLSAL